MKTIYKVTLPVISFILITQTISAQKDNWEWRMLRTIEDNRTSGKTSFYKTISASTYLFSLGTPAAYLISGMINKDNNLKKTALYITESIAITEAVTFATKSIVNRERPAIADPSFTAVTKAKNASFPSGHTSAAFSVATSLTIVKPKWYVYVPAFTWASLVGYSRMYLGVHYPTDILAGAVIGSGGAWLSYRMNKWMHGKSNNTLKPAPSL